MRFIPLIFFFVGIVAKSQSTTDYSNEIASITLKYDSIWNQDKETIVFTGSSSVRLWSNLQELFPERQIVNSGFGGSEAEDLLEHIDPLVLRYHPVKVFIYEGDNDLANETRIREILKSMKGIITKIKQNDNTKKIILISPKPSISRWHLKRKYKRLNRKLQSLCKHDETLEFADVWDVMLEKRKLKTELFIEDGLHMNAKGYQLWFDVIADYMDYRGFNDH